MKMFAQRQKAGMDGLLKIENIPPPPHVIVIKQDTQTELTFHSGVILWLVIKKRLCYSLELMKKRQKRNQNPWELNYVSWKKEQKADCSLTLVKHHQAQHSTKTNNSNRLQTAHNKYQSSPCLFWTLWSLQLQTHCSESITAGNISEDWNKWLTS